MGGTAPPRPPTYLIMAHYKFKEDLKDGKVGEALVARHLEAQGWTFVGDNDDGNYDLEMLRPDAQPYIIEVKRDFKAHETGNVTIEFGRKDGTPSGITTTRAHAWAYLIDATRVIYWFGPREVKALLAEPFFSDIRKLLGGDDKLTWMHLVKITGVV